VLDPSTTKSLIVQAENYFLTFKISPKHLLFIKSFTSELEADGFDSKPCGGQEQLQKFTFA
jgi:hypothetical protein